MLCQEFIAMISIKSHIHHISKQRQVDSLTDHLLTNTNYEDTLFTESYFFHGS